VVPAASLKETAIDCAIVGSCAAGGLDDLAVAARLLQGRKVAGGVSLLVTPATRKVMLAADRAGILATLLEAGATLLNPSCGACGGIDKGIPAVGDNVISTAPRNYSSRTRMGANVFLASTATCVASAMAGRITAPQEAGA
jgi:3-isopropylmalate/(R)-2-methylmalate dehydratase large subunit